MKTILSALLIAFALASSCIAAPKDRETTAKLLIGKWQAARHLTQYLPNRTFLMDAEPGTPPRGTWRLEGNKLLKTFSEGGTDIYTIISISKSEMVIANQEGKQYSLKRVN